MDIKVQLAELCAAYTLPMREFCQTPAYLNLEKEPEIIEKIEQYHLPEITKLICGSKSLSEQDWAAPYQRISSLYQTYPHLDVVKILLSFQKVSEFETGILKYADHQMLEKFENYFEELRKKLDRKRKERTSIKKKIQKIKKEQPEEQVPEVSEETEKAEMALKTLEEEIARLCSFLKEEKAFADKITEYLQKEEKIEENRAAVYGLFREQKVPREEKFLRSFIQTGVMTEEEERLFRDDSFVACLLLYMGEDSMRDYAIPILMKLYDEGVIDLVEGPASDFIDGHPQLLCTFLREKLSVVRNPTEEEELLLDKALQKEFCSDPSPFTGYWNSLTDGDSWTWIISRLHELDPDSNLNSRIACMLSKLGTDAGNALAETVSRWQEPDVPVALMEIYSEWMRQNKIPGGAMLLDYIRGLNQNTHKLQRKLNTAERRIRSQGQEVFSSLYRPVEQLEELVVSLSGTRGEVKAGLVSSSLKSIVTELREGLETLDVQPLTDIDDWKLQNEIEFDSRIHSLTAAVNGKPCRVSLNSMGFQYCDEEGEQKQYNAKVSPVDKKIRRTQAHESRHGYKSGEARNKLRANKSVSYRTGESVRRNQRTSLQRNKRGHQK